MRGIGKGIKKGIKDGVRQEIHRFLGSINLSEFDKNPTLRSKIYNLRDAVNKGSVDELTPNRLNIHKYIDLEKLRGTSEQFVK
jgi:hypothetical protein